MRLIVFGRATRDETLYLSTHFQEGGNTPLVRSETVHGGMVSWAGRTIRNAGHRPVLVGSAGLDTPHDYLGENVEDRLFRDGESFHIRVLVGPDGQRSFLAPDNEPFPPLEITAEKYENVDGILFDGYALLPGRNDLDAEKLLSIATQGGTRRLPTVVTLPVAQVLTARDRPQHLQRVLTRLHQISPLTVCGASDEHDALGMARSPWVSIKTTGLVEPLIVVEREGEVLHQEPVTLEPNPRNTNGAGDVFAAGILLGLVEERPLAHTLLRGHEVAKTHVMR